MSDLHTYQENKEISLKDLIKKIINVYHFLKSKIVVIIASAFLGSVVFLAYAIVKKPVYNAGLTFALEDRSSSGGLGAYAGIASQFGLNLGGSAGGAFSGDNIIELLKSRKMVEKTLLTPVKINGKDVLLINRYIDYNKLREDWEEEPLLKNLTYSINQDREKFSIQQDSVLGKVFEKIYKSDLQVEKIDKKLSIISIQFKSRDELFSKLFTEQLAYNVTTFYIETKTQKSKANIALLENRVDSVKRELDKEMYGYAVSQDQNQNLIRAQARVPSAKRQMNIQLLTTMYGELVKNLELSKITLSREEPILQIIDTPILPLKKAKPSKLKSIIIGGFLGGFLCVLYLLISLSYRNIMKS